MYGMYLMDHFIAFAILKEVEAEKAREEARVKELAAGKEEQHVFTKYL